MWSVRAGGAFPDRVVVANCGELEPRIGGEDIKLASLYIYIYSIFIFGYFAILLFAILLLHSPSSVPVNVLSVPRSTKGTKLGRPWAH